MVKKASVKLCKIYNVLLCLYFELSDIFVLHCHEMHLFCYKIESMGYFSGHCSAEIVCLLVND